MELNGNEVMEGYIIEHTEHMKWHVWTYSKQG